MNKSSGKINQPATWLCFLALGVLAYVNRNSANEEDSSAIEQTAVQPLSTDESSRKIDEKHEESPSPPPVHSIGENFQMGEFSYVINSVKKTDHIGISGSDIFSALGSKTEKANMDAIMQAVQTRMKEAGVNPPENASSFLIIQYKIKNEGKEASVISTTDFKVIDSKGRTFTTSAKATTELVENESEDFLFSELQPGISKTGVQAFELPNDSFDGKLTLLVPEKGIFGSKVVKVDLEF